MLNREFIHRIYIIIALLVIAGCGCITMLAADGDTDITAYYGYAFLLTFVVLLPGLLPYIKLRFKSQHIQHPIQWLTVLLIWVAFVSLLINMTNFNNAIGNCLFNAFIPLLAMVCTYAYSSQYGLNNAIYWTAITLLLIFIVQYAAIYNVANWYGEAHLMTAYYALFMLPLVLLHPSKIIKFAAILIVIVVIFSSIKRGGFVALIIGLSFYIIGTRNISSKGVKSYIYALLAISALAILFYVLANSELGSVLERMQNIKEDGGSNRDQVWVTTWNMIQESETISYIFGHGNNAVLLNSPLELSAHNDFLESWYDYGLLGLFLYTFSLIALIRYTLYLIHKKSPVAPSLAMLIGIMLTLTTIAHVLIYYFMTLSCMTIGLIIGQNVYSENQIKTN